MRPSIVPMLLGISTVVVTTVASAAPVSAAVFQVESGATSVFLDFEDILSPLGIDLVGADNVTEPAEGPFQVGFNILPESDFTFSDDNTLTPISGAIEHSGSITLAIDTLGDDLTVGNFTIGFDPSRVSAETTGFFVQDTLSLNEILFDISNPPTALELSADSLVLGSGLAISSEFAGVLEGLDKPGLGGAVVGVAQINANLESEAASVPEPASVLALLLTGTVVFVSHRRSLKSAAA